MKRYATTALLAAGFALFAWAGGAQAQSFPARPVTLIVPWAAGGTTDIGMRALASATEKHLGAAIVVENRPGGSGTLGPGQMAATAKPDGYTIAQIPITIFRFPFMTKTTFDPAKDFSYIIGLSGYAFGVVVKDDAPWKTFAELIAEAKANPGKINYGTPGVGTSLHITMEQIAKQQGIKWTHVPYKGSAETTRAVLGGHIHAVADSSGWAQLVNAGQLRLLVTWGAVRTKNWPTVPTLQGGRHRHGLELAVRHRRSARHGPGHRQGSARRLQEGDGGPILHRGDDQARHGAVLFEQRGLRQIRHRADRGGEAVRRRARPQAGLNVG